MPSIYLSPSLQEYNPFYDNSGSEEYYMNLIADAMEPYLTASGIDFVRNTPNMTLSQVINQSNAGNYALHLALHSNAAAAENAGTQTGSDVYYYASSTAGKRAADIFVQNLKDIYPYPNRVRAISNTTFAELRRTSAPAILIETAYHDNASDAEWIKNNIQAIGRTYALSVAEFLDVPFIEPQPLGEGVVATGGANLYLRASPSLEGEILARIPNGSILTIISKTGNWYAVNYNDQRGYAFADYIQSR